MEQKTIKQMQDEKFNWVGRQSATKRFSANDVSLNLIKVGGGKDGKSYYGYSLTFRNDTWINFGNSIEIAAYKNRILFRKSSDGLKLASKKGSKTNNHYCKINTCDDETMKALKEFIGDYELKYDQFYELYYIEK